MWQSPARDPHLPGAGSAPLSRPRIREGGLAPCPPAGSVAEAAAPPRAGDLVGDPLEARSSQQPCISRGRDDFVWGTPFAGRGRLACLGRAEEAVSSEPSPHMTSWGCFPAGLAGRPGQGCAVVERNLEACLHRTPALTLVKKASSLPVPQFLPANGKGGPMRRLRKWCRFPAGRARGPLCLQVVIVSLTLPLLCPRPIWGHTVPTGECVPVVPLPTSHSWQRGHLRSGASLNLPLLPAAGPSENLPGLGGGPPACPPPA